MKDRDPISIWYSFLEELGESVDIRFVRTRLGSAEGQWYSLTHRSFDGLGGFAHLLRESGYEPGALPAIQPALRRRGWLADPLSKLRALLRMATYPPRGRVPWRRVERGWRARGAEGAGDPARPREAAAVADAIPTAAAWRVLSSAETEQLLARAKEQGITLNSLLLWALNRALVAALVDAPQDRFAGTWMVPVNLRGAVPASRDTDNQSSFLTVRVSPKDDAARLHARIEREKATGLHWAAWRVAKWGTRVSVRLARRKVYSDYRRPGHPWMGAFSNLGSWDVAGAPPDEAWLIFPSVSLVRPLSAGALTYGRKLGLSLQAHPALSRDPLEARRWLERWLDEVLRT